MCVWACAHPWHMARGQMQADNILKETLQHYTLTSTDSDVYSNQRHNRWRGMSLWQADLSLRFLKLQSTGTDSIKAFPYKKRFLSAAENKQCSTQVPRYSHTHRCVICHYSFGVIFWIFPPVFSSQGYVWLHMVHS